MALPKRNRNSRLIHQYDPDSFLPDHQAGPYSIEEITVMLEQTRSASGYKSSPPNAARIFPLYSMKEYQSYAIYNIFWELLNGENGSIEKFTKELNELAKYLTALSIFDSMTFGDNGIFDRNQINIVFEGDDLLEWCCVTLTKYDIIRRKIDVPLYRNVDDIMHTFCIYSNERLIYDAQMSMFKQIITEFKLRKYDHIEIEGREERCIHKDYLSRLIHSVEEGLRQWLRMVTRGGVCIQSMVVPEKRFYLGRDQLHDEREIFELSDHYIFGKKQYKAVIHDTEDHYNYIGTSLMDAAVDFGDIQIGDDVLVIEKNNTEKANSIIEEIVALDNVEPIYISEMHAHHKEPKTYCNIEHYNDWFFGAYSFPGEDEVWHYIGSDQQRRQAVLTSWRDDYFKSSLTSFIMERIPVDRIRKNPTPPKATHQLFTFIKEKVSGHEKEIWQKLSYDIIILPEEKYVASYDKERILNARKQGLGKYIGEYPEQDYYYSLYHALSDMYGGKQKDGTIITADIEPIDPGDPDIKEKLTDKWFDNLIDKIMEIGLSNDADIKMQALKDGIPIQDVIA